MVDNTRLSQHRGRTFNVDVNTKKKKYNNNFVFHVRFLYMPASCTPGLHHCHVLFKNLFAKVEMGFRFQVEFLRSIGNLAPEV